MLLSVLAVIDQTVRNLLDGLSCWHEPFDLAHAFINRTRPALAIGHCWAGWRFSHLGDQIAAGFGIKETLDEMQVEICIGVCHFVSSLEPHATWSWFARIVGLLIVIIFFTL